MNAAGSQVEVFEYNLTLYKTSKTFAMTFLVLFLVRLGESSTAIQAECQKQKLSYMNLLGLRNDDA